MQNRGGLRWVLAAWGHQRKQPPARVIFVTTTATNGYKEETKPGLLGTHFGTRKKSACSDLKKAEMP